MTPEELDKVGDKLLEVLQQHQMLPQDGLTALGSAMCCIYLRLVEGKALSYRAANDSVDRLCDGIHQYLADNCKGRN